MWHSEPKKGLQFPKKRINLWSTWIVFEYNVTKHKKKSMPHASNNKRKENKNIGHKNYMCLNWFWLVETQKNLLRSIDNWAKSTEEIMTDGISACSEGTNDKHLHMLEYMLN